MTCCIYRCIAVALLFCVLTTPCQALTLFEANYDADIYAIQQINFDIIPSVLQDWVPFRAASEYLPIDVSWDESTKEVVVYSHELARTNIFYKEQRYKPCTLPPTLTIVDGVTYCSPQFLKNNLSGRGFVYNGEVFYFSGETVESKLIKSNGNNVFKDNAITSMYQLKLKSPDDYAFVRKYLTGGIEYVQRNNIPKNAFGAYAYIYPNRRKPVCYIVKGYSSDATLASYIAHEAYHVYEYKTNGKSTEKAAKKYQQTIFNKLIALK